jgi:hypothetical protein
VHLTRTRFRRRVLRGALFFFAGLTILACGRAPEPLTALPDNLPTRAAVAEVPLILQADFFCGPASLAMVHQWAGLNVTQAEVARHSFTPGAEGTYLADMLGAARRRGQLAVPIAGFENLMREVAAGNPVIAFQNLGLKIAPRWHYGVVVAYDLDADRIDLNSGEHKRMVMPVRLFRRTWARGDDWAIVVLPPDRLPKSAGPWDIARAAVELEKVDPRAAARTYAAAGERWPQMWVFPFGLGNAQYAQGDLNGARRAWQTALAIDPNIPEIRANLDELSRPAG